jgi:hypothetical protein
VERTLCKRDRLGRGGPESPADWGKSVGALLKRQVGRKEGAGKGAKRAFEMMSLCSAVCERHVLQEYTRHPGTSAFPLAPSAGAGSPPSSSADWHVMQFPKPRSCSAMAPP